MEALGVMRYEIGVEHSKGKNIMFAKPEIERNVQKWQGHNEKQRKLYGYHYFSLYEKKCMSLLSTHWCSLCFVLFLYASLSNNRSVLALDSSIKSVASLFASVSLTNPCPPSLAEVKSGLKNREIIPPQCSLLYQSHALLQILMMNGSFSALHRPSTLVLLFGNDFI